jgi:hypothetical protein
VVLDLVLLLLLWALLLLDLSLLNAVQAMVW